MENPNPPEEPKAPEGETVVLSKAEHDELVEKLSTETQTKSNLVEEIKDLREKKTAAETAAEEARKELEEKNLAGSDEGTELTAEKIAAISAEATQKILDAKATTDKATSKELALQKFKELHKEFHEDNDEGGLKFSALEKKLSRFNTSDISTESEYLVVLKDAYKLLVEVKPEETPAEELPIDPKTGSPIIKEVTLEGLTPKELRIIERTFDGDKERYIKQKSKHPEMIESLLRHAH